MSYYKKIEYTVVPNNPYKLIKSCGKCRCKTTFECTNKFRVNANSNLIDVWLIYRCNSCKQTYNLPVYERISAKKLKPQDYNNFMLNNEELVLKIGTDKNLFAKNKCNIIEKNIDFSIVFKDFSVDYLKQNYYITVNNPYNLKIKAKDFLSNILTTSKTKIKKYISKNLISIPFKLLQTTTQFATNLTLLEKNIKEQKKFCILMGSPHKSGNTATITTAFINRLKERDADIDYVFLYDLSIAACKGCYCCQNIENNYGCVIKDDVQMIMEKIILSDCVVFATPIFSWYCTAPMKALLDRHYGLNKFYGNTKGSLWKGKRIALITTNGYEKDYATEPFELGIKRLCTHSDLNYLGLYSVTDDDCFQASPQLAINGAASFADQILNDIINN